MAFGGSVVAAYAAYRFLSAKSDEERAHYDWMGYVAMFIAVIFLIPLPFAGYWLMRGSLCLSSTNGDHVDGRPPRLVVHYSGHDDWSPLPKHELLFVAIA